jgi:nucleoid DNA-binding protein
MEKDFQFVKDNYIHKTFKKRTRLKGSEINLIIDLMILLIKKKVAFTNELMVFNFGKFHTIKTFTRRILRISMSEKFLIVCKGKQDLKYRDWLVSADSKPLIKSLSKILNIKYKHAKFVFILFFIGLCKHLLIKKAIKFDCFGEISKTELITKDQRLVTSLKFKASKSFNRELNQKTENFYITKRLKHIVKIHKINIATK